MEVPQPPKRLDHVRQAIRFRHLTRKTDKSYLHDEKFMTKIHYLVFVLHPKAWLPNVLVERLPTIFATPPTNFSSPLQPSF